MHIKTITKKIVLCIKKRDQAVDIFIVFDILKTRDYLGRNPAMKKKKSIFSIKNLLCYGGLTQEEYEEIKPAIYSDSQKLWRILSIVITIIYLVSLISSLFFSTISTNTYAYLAMVLVCIPITLVFIFVKKISSGVLLGLIYLLTLFILIFSLFLGVILDASVVSVTFMVMVVILPTLIIDKPYRTICMSLSMAVIFSVCAIIFKTGSVLALDIYNCWMFSIMGMTASVYSTYYRFSGYSDNVKVNKLANTDVLTGLGNETAYFALTDRIEKRLAKTGGFDFAIIVMDVNGVKQTNDTYGHRFGCHLIVTTGHVLKTIFTNSKVFHIGGDEFIAILQGRDYKNRQALMDKFDDLLVSREIVYKDVPLTLTVARGMCEYAEGMTYSQMFDDADTAMYKNKRAIKRKQAAELKAQQEAEALARQEAENAVQEQLEIADDDHPTGDEHTYVLKQEDES